MTIAFSKYQGTGNDFIIVDNRLLKWNPSSRTVAQLCHRHFGIGADGLMLLDAEDGYDFRMTYFNSDGNESTMCGNGGRCITVFARELGLIGDKAHFSAIDGTHESILKSGQKMWLCRLKMKDAVIGKVHADGIFIDTGSPHLVTFITNAADTEVVASGRMIRHDPRFAPGGVNVDFVEVTGSGLFVRTYERGVEDETLSCGTGVTAAVLAYAFLHPENRDIPEVRTRGGSLKVSYQQAGPSFQEVWLEGPAEKVFEGHIHLNIEY